MAQGQHITVRSKLAYAAMLILQ